MKRRTALAAAVAFPVLLAILYYFQPTNGSYYPRCFFYSSTGWHCPGCGATRAVHALLHGNLLQAAAYNLLFLIALPYLLFMGGRAWLQAVLGRKVANPRLPSWALGVLLTIVILFGILRNLPFSPFTLLAPHEL